MAGVLRIQGPLGPGLAKGHGAAPNYRQGTDESSCELFHKGLLLRLASIGISPAARLHASSGPQACQVKSKDTVLMKGLGGKPFDRYVRDAELRDGRATKAFTPWFDWNPSS